MPDLIERLGLTELQCRFVADRLAGDDADLVERLVPAHAGRNVRLLVEAADWGRSWTYEAGTRVSKRVDALSSDPIDFYDEESAPIARRPVDFVLVVKFADHLR